MNVTNQYKQLIDTIMEDKFDLIDLADGMDIDYERREQAGKVVQPLNYAKRVRMLITDLPQTIVDTICENGHETPGLKGRVWRYPHEVRDLRQWYDGVYGLLPLETKDKFDTLNSYKEKAYELLPRQTEYTDNDVETAFESHFQRIFEALVNSSQELEHKQFAENMDQSDLARIYGG
jgi:hypothetical protein